MGQKAMADSVMPVKKIAERIQSVIVIWPKTVESRRELAGGDNGSVGEGGHALFVHAGQQVLDAMMEQDRTELCGPRGKHDPERRAGRAGTTASEVTLGGGGAFG